MTFKALLTRSLAGAARVAAGIFTVLVGFQLVLVAVAASYEEAHSFERMVQFVPGVFQRSLGGTLSAFATFKGLVTMGYFHPLVVITVTQFAIYLASEPAGEVENRLLDLLLARRIVAQGVLTTFVIAYAVQAPERLPRAATVSMVANGLDFLVFCLVCRPRCLLQVFNKRVNGSCPPVRGWNPCGAQACRKSKRCRRRWRRSPTAARGGRAAGRSRGSRRRPAQPAPRRGTPLERAAG